MRFLKLEVENFKAITSAALELGPGLNVLYGPNDLGKSTLGAALKAVLLMQSNSSAATEYQPWQDAVSPLVTLTFQDDSDKFWRVTKRFTENDAKLSFSKDGKDFTVDAHERQVDEKLRKLLGWGIATPGGRNAPRGMPESFLANVLLAAQTDVDKVLRESLEGDTDASGKLKLTTALSALAQDPLVRQVLGAAQKEHDRFFSATGKRRTGQTAPLTLASEAVKRLEAERVAIERDLSQSSALEEESKRRHAVWLEAQQACEQLEQRLKASQAGRERAMEKRAAQARVVQAHEALAQVEGLAARLTALDVELLTAKEEVLGLERALKVAQEASQVAARGLRDAEDAHRKASSAEGESERAVARAELTAELSARQLERSELAARLEREAEAARVEAEFARLTNDQQRATAALATARTKAAEVQAESNLVDGILNYGLWRSASDLVQQADRLRAEAKTGRAEALKKTSDALSLQQQAKTLEEELAQRRALLPDDKARTALERLRRDFDLAEAALGGGVTVLVRPRSPLLLRSTADENPAEETKLSRELAIEADRRVQLSIGDLVEVEVIAGAAEKRKDAEHLRKRWRTEALPALERAGVRTLAELNEAAASLSEVLERAKALRAQATQTEVEAKALRDRAAMLDEKAAGAPSATQVASKREAIGPLSLEILEQSYVSMGSEWEEEIGKAQRRTVSTLTAANTAVNKLENELEVLGHRLIALEGKRGPAPREPQGPTLASLDAALAKLTEKLQALETARSGAVKQAALALETAKWALVKADDAAAKARSALDDSRASSSTKKGEREAVAQQLAKLDRAKVQGALETAKKALEAYADVELLSDEERLKLERSVDEARAAADQAGRDYATAEGALSKVGGPQAREQARQLEEALTVAKAHEHLLEVDAASWRLLVEAVREAEKEDSSSLGSALSAPVTERFAELTKGRYPSVKFDPSLRASGLEVPGTQVDPADVITALSVGTRDQLAMLVRLAIALQLKSAIVLDDHLVHTDLGRLSWFQEALAATAAKTQVLVLTCRPLDYVPQDALPTKSAFLDRDGRRVIDLTKIIQRR